MEDSLLCLEVYTFLFVITVNNIFRLGLRGDFLSFYTNFFYEPQRPQTVETRMRCTMRFSDLSYAAISIPVFFISATKGFPELKSSCDIGCGSILESIVEANNINWTCRSNRFESSKFLKISAKSMSLSSVDFPFAYEPNK